MSLKSVVFGWINELLHNEKAVQEVLRILSVARLPMFGKEILTRCKPEFGVTAIYPALRYMEGEGLVICQEISSPRILALRGGRVRHYYKITDLGRARFVGTK